MNILSTQYTLPHKAYEIYLAGCAGNPHCEGCHNPVSWDFQAGYPCDGRTLRNIARDIKLFDALIDRIMVMGGEPLDQDMPALNHLLAFCKRTGKSVWLFTRYEKEEAVVLNPLLPSLCDYLKCGRYIPTLRCDNNVQFGIPLATSNQYVVQSSYLSSTTAPSVLS